MTSSLVRILSTQSSSAVWSDLTVRLSVVGKDAHPSLEDLMTGVSHQIHKFYLDLHERSRQYKKKVRAANDAMVRSGKAPKEGDEVEMNNFQNPQVGSFLNYESTSLIGFWRSSWCCAQLSSDRPLVRPSFMKMSMSCIDYLCNLCRICLGISIHDKFTVGSDGGTALPSL